MKTEWQPIETAPKDGTRILLGFSNPIFNGVYCSIGRWEDERFYTKKRPHWTNDLSHLMGTINTRNNQPSFWMPLPNTPTK